MTDDRVASWLAALEARCLADLTPAEAARALRALSSCYVERRVKLPQGGALESAGKRAAFALFYGPLHFFVTREILAALSSLRREEEPTASAPAPEHVRRILDIGCGTGAAGAAWAMLAGGAALSGVDRNRWAVAEANWTYAALGLPGRARQADIGRIALHGVRGMGIVAAFVVNELPDATRARLLPLLHDARARGARVLVVEPIARRISTWWDAWAREALARGGRADEWRFPIALPERQRSLGRAAGLDPRGLTARSLWL